MLDTPSLDSQERFLCKKGMENRASRLLFTMYKKVPENLVGKRMEHDFFGRSTRKLPGATELLKRYSDGMIQTEIRVPFLQSHL